MPHVEEYPDADQLDAGGLAAPDDVSGVVPACFHKSQHAQGLFAALDFGGVSYSDTPPHQRNQNTKRAAYRSEMPMSDKSANPPKTTADATPEKSLPVDGKPRLTILLKTIHDSVKQYFALLGLLVGVPDAMVYFDEKLGIHNPWISLAMAIIPALLILAWWIPQWVDERNKKKMIALGISGQIKRPEYFQLVPYESDQNFHRADGVHLALYEWAITSQAPLLFVSGKSGSGKSSIISGWVIPKIKAENLPIRVIRVRVVGNPIAAIQRALFEPGAIWPQAVPAMAAELELRAQLEKCAKKLVPQKLWLVLDQFEEFLILADATQREAFREVLRSLADKPLPGLRVLMVLRSDYLGWLGKLDLPPLVQHRNWEEVPPFTERDALDFLRGSGLAVTRELEAEIVKEAREIEETAGMIRPITINLFGLVLRRFECLPKGYKPGTLLRSYLRDQAHEKTIREFAPRILRAMITDNSKQTPVTLAEIAKATKFGDAHQIRGVLIRLGSAGLVRELDTQAGTWEIAHDFIAQLYDHILVGWRLSLWRQVRPWVIGAGFFVWLMGFLAVSILWNNWAEMEAIKVLNAHGFRVEKNGDGTANIYKSVAGLEKGITNMDFEATISYLPYLSVQSLDLSYTDVTNLEALKRLTGLQSLYLFETKITSVEALKGLTGLQWLDLRGTKVTDVETLKGLTRLNIIRE